MDNVRNEITAAATDIIKIRPAKGGRACLFLDAAQAACTIYDRRPVECAAQRCWDTDEIERIYDADRLTRADLLENAPELCDLLQTHQERCGYDEIRHLSRRVPDHRDSDAERRLMELIRYDWHLRELVMEKGRIAPTVTDFLFGTPLWSVLHRFGLELRRTPGGERILPATSKGQNNQCPVKSMK